MFFDSVETKEVELKNCLDMSKPLSEYKRLFFGCNRKMEQIKKREKKEGKGGGNNRL